MTSQNELGSAPFPFIFLRRSLRRIGVNSLNIWWNSPVKTSGLRLFFAERFLITDSTPSLVTGLLSFLFLVGSVFIVVCF